MAGKFNLAMNNRYSLSRHHFFVQWGILGLALLLIGLFIGYSLFKEYYSTGVRERDRLQHSGQGNKPYYSATP